MKRPFVWFVCGLMSGIVSAEYIDTAGFAAVLVLVVAASVLFGVKNRVREYFYIPIFAVIGFILCPAISGIYKGPGDILDGKDVYATGTVRSSYITDSGNTAISLETDRVIYDEDVYDKRIKIFVTCERTDVKAGNVIRVKGRIYGYEKPDNPYQTDYGMYMFSNGYSCNMWAEELENTGAMNGSLIYRIEAAREKVNEFFDGIMPENVSSVMKALTTGYKYDIDDNTRENYKNMGVSHLLAVSGLHVSVIAGAVFLVLTKIFRGSRRKAMPFAAAFLILYLFFTGVSPSAVRAVFMTITMYFGYIISRGTDRLNITAFSAFVMLLANPLYLWNISFQLSYAGITAVALTEDMIKDHKDIGPVSKVLMFSLGVWIMTSPLTMYYFGGISLIAPLSNIIFVPYLSFSTGLGLLASLLSIFDVKTMGTLIAKTAGGMVWLYNTMGDRAGTDGFYLDTLKPSAAAVIGIYAFMLSVIYFRNNKKVLMRTMTVFMAAAAIYMTVWINRPSEIVFFDAGQGDASAVFVPGEFTAVIDGGPEGGAESSVIPYLESKSGKADILFITHTDSDHAAGAMEIINQELTKTVVLSKYADGKRAKEISKAAKDKGIDVVYASAGDSFGTDECRIECLYPMGDTAEDENETSLVLKFTVGKTEALFTGDIDSDNEDELLKSDIDCDIIKIAHHGSDTSSSEEFLRRTGADAAVIEADEDNIYGFPSSEVVQRLNRLGFDTYITGCDGAVVFYLDQKGSIEDIKTFKE